MATQLRSTRQLSIAGETLDWTEVDPYIWELAFPGGPRIGQIVEIPAHGRSKQAWQRQDTGTQYHSAMVACSDLLTAYYRRQAHTPTADPAPEPPRLMLVPPAPQPERKPLGVPDGWMTKAAAAKAYEISLSEMDGWIAAGLLEHVTAGAAIYVPPPEPPPAPAPDVVTEQTGRWVAATEAARVLGITATTIHERIHSGKLHGRKVSPPGKRWQWEVLLTEADAPAPVAEQPALLLEPKPAPKLTAPAPAEPAAGIPSEPEQDGRWVTKAEAAQLLGMGITGIQARISAGTIPARKVYKNSRMQWEVQISDSPAPAPPPAPTDTRQDTPPTTENTSEDTTHRMTADTSLTPAQIIEQQYAAILEYIRQYGSISTEDCVKHFQLSPDAAKRRFHTLLMTGRVQRVMRGHYELPSVPESTPAPTEPPPEPAPLADFPSPTIEVPIIQGHDDHPLEADPAPALDMRLLAAMQRIGYLEAQLEHWQDRAMELGRKLQTLQGEYDQLTHAPAPDGDPALAGPIAREPKPRRWFPFNW